MSHSLKMNDPLLRSRDQRTFAFIQNRKHLLSSKLMNANLNSREISIKRFLYVENSSEFEKVIDINHPIFPLF